jgi:hypothetical protein
VTDAQLWQAGVNSNRIVVRGQGAALGSSRPTKEMRGARGQNVGRRWRNRNYVLDVIAFRFCAIETARLSSGGATLYETRPSKRCLGRLGGVMIIAH